MPDDLSDLRKKTHIDHSIRLVKHKNFYVSEVDRASLDQIVQQYEELKQKCLKQQQRSSLTEEVDEEGINQLLANVYQSFWSRV